MSLGCLILSLIPLHYSVTLNTCYEIMNVTPEDEETPEDDEQFPPFVPGETPCGGTCQPLN
jgi:hypothetical protein